jgi:spore coat protein A
VNSHTVTRIIVPFVGYPGRYVWHCHILEHEEHDMMHALVVI